MNAIVLTELKRLKRRRGRKLKVFDPTNLRHRFEKAVKDAGLKDFTFHDLRHSFASNLVSNNVSIITIKELLGHKSVKMTLRYAHPSESQLKKAVEKIESDVVAEEGGK